MLTLEIHEEINKETNPIYERMVRAIPSTFSSYEEYLEWHALQIGYILQVLNAYGFTTFRKYDNALRKLGV